MSNSPSPSPTASRPFAVPAGPWVGFVAVLLLFTLLIGIKGELGTFLSLGNLDVLLHEGTVPAIVALGMLLVLISGGIDLSVGAVVALVTVVTMRVYTAMHQGEPSAAQSLCAVAAGVTRSATTRMIPTAWRLMTIVSATSARKTYSISPVRKPDAPAPSGSNVA